MGTVRVATGTKVRPKSASIAAVITRADGTVEDLGIVSYYHRNPLKRWAMAIKIKRAERARRGR